MKDERRHTAYHEAGHAAAQLVFGQTPERFSIERTEGKLGFAAHLDGDLDTEDGIRAMIINCFAGREAEIRAGGPGTGSEGDDNEAYRYIRDFLSIAVAAEMVRLADSKSPITARKNYLEKSRTERITEAFLSVLPNSSWA